MCCLFPHRAVTSYLKLDSDLIRSCVYHITYKEGVCVLERMFIYGDVVLETQADTQAALSRG